eukprot:2150145-Amphidinium_carterae.1
MLLDAISAMNAKERLRQFFLFLRTLCVDVEVQEIRAPSEMPATLDVVLLAQGKATSMTRGTLGIYL